MPKASTLSKCSWWRIHLFLCMCVCLCACVCVLVGFWPYSSHVSNVLNKTPILFNMPQTCSHARRKNCTVFMDQIGKRVEQVWWNSYPYITLSTTKLFFGQCTTTVQSKSGQVDTKPDESTGIWRFQLQGSGQTQEIHWVSTGYPSVHWENLKDRQDMNVTCMIWPYYDILWPTALFINLSFPGMLHARSSRGRVYSVDAENKGWKLWSSLVTSWDFAWMVPIFPALVSAWQ